MNYVGPSRCATPEQLATLVTLMERDKRTCQGEWAGPQGCKGLHKHWDYLALNHLNEVPHGEVKSGEQWRQVWYDQKKHVRAVATKLAKLDRGTGGGKAQSLLTSYQDRVLKVLGGWDSVVGFSEVIDPLEIDPLTIGRRERAINAPPQKRLKQEEVIHISDEEDEGQDCSASSQDPDLQWALDESLRISTSLTNYDQDLEDAVSASLAESVPIRDNSFDAALRLALVESLKSVQRPMEQDFDFVTEESLAISASLSVCEKDFEDAINASLACVSKVATPTCLGPTQPTTSSTICTTIQATEPACSTLCVLPTEVASSQKVTLSASVSKVASPRSVAPSLPTTLSPHLTVETPRTAVGAHRYSVSILRPRAAVGGPQMPAGTLRPAVPAPRPVVGPVRPAMGLARPAVPRPVAPVQRPPVARLEYDWDKLIAQGYMTR